ncbi:MAG: FtsL-like putative cell division protein [Bacteroidales bacterium]|nr:FtsL-like putative cell division protein [Bacteroidales bacterium]
MKKIDWAKVRKATVNLTKSILRGDIVLKLDRFLPHVVYIAFLCALSIYINLKMDETMVRREQNRRTLEQTKVYCSQKICELAELRQVNNIEKLLEERGIDVSMPEKPARNVRRR